MTTVDADGNKILLPRLGPDDFWQEVYQHYAKAKPLRWKYLAMLTLYETAGWTLEQIAQSFGHNRGHVCRCIEKTKADLRRNFADGRQKVDSLTR